MLAVYAAGENVYDYVLNCHNGLTFAELKYDGYRLQLHKKGGVVKGFTRNLNDVPLDIYPEISESIKKLPDCILDCELNGGTGHTGFKVIQKRFRLKAQDVDKYLKNVDTTKPLELRVFDTLYVNGKWMLDTPLAERRKETEKIDERMIRAGEQWKISTPQNLEDLFENLSKQKHEGLVCKNPESLYKPGDSHTDWLKLKRFETFDLVLLGVYMDGDRITQLLCGSYNNEKNCFETLAKVNAKRGCIEDTVAAFIRGLPKDKPLSKNKPDSIFISPNATKEDLPGFYTNPFSSLVIEIKAMNVHYGRNWHSCSFDGTKSYSLRIAWAKSIRDDKTPLQATTTKKVAELYKIQEG